MPAQQVLRIFLSFSHRSRPPSNRIPFAVRSDSVRVTMTFREVFTANIRQAERLIAATQYFFTGKPTYL